MVRPKSRDGNPGFAPDDMYISTKLQLSELYNNISILEDRIKTVTYRNIEIRYLELVCHLFGGLNPPKEDSNSIQNMGHWGSRYADVLYTLETSCIPSTSSLRQSCILDSFDFLSCSMDSQVTFRVRCRKLDATQPSPSCDTLLVIW